MMRVCVTCMEPAVDDKTGAVDKTHIAKFTSVRPFTRMSPHVNFEVRLVCKSFATLFAYVRFLTYEFQETHQEIIISFRSICTSG